MFFKLFKKEFLNYSIDVLTTASCVTVSSLDFNNSIVDLKDRDIKGSTSQVVDCDSLFFLFFHSVSQGGGCGLVDDSLNLETCDPACILCGLSLGVVEIGRDGDNGPFNFLAKIGLGSLLHLHENEGSDLGRRVILALGLNPGVPTGVPHNFIRHVLGIILDGGLIETTTDQALGSEDRIFGIGDGLPLCGSTDQTLALAGEGHNRRSSSSTLGILNDLRHTSFHDGNTRVCGAEIDSDDGAGLLGGEAG